MPETVFLNFSFRSQGIDSKKSISPACVAWWTEPVFVDLLRRPGIDSQPGGPVRNPICRTGPPGYTGWRNRFLGIDSWAP
jgi:hypothetical protein